MKMKFKILNYFLMLVLSPLSVYAQQEMGFRLLSQQFVGLLQSYSTSPYLIDAILIFTFFLIVIKQGLKKAKGSWDDKAIGSISTIVSLIITIPLIILEYTKGVYLAQVVGGRLGPISSTIILFAILIITIVLLAILLKKEQRKYAIPILIFVAHNAFMNYTDWYRSFLEANPLVATFVWIIFWVCLIFTAWAVIIFITHFFGFLGKESRRDFASTRDVFRRGDKGDKDTEDEIKEDIDKTTSTVKREKKWAIREYTQLQTIKKLLESDDPKKVVEAAEMQRKIIRISRRVDKYFKRALDNIKTLEKKTGQEDQLKEYKRSLQIANRSLLVLLERIYPEYASQILNLLNKEGKFRTSGKDPREHPGVNIYNPVLEKLKKCVDDAIEQDRVIIQIIKNLEEAVEKLQ